MLKKGTISCCEGRYIMTHRAHGQWVTQTRALKKIHQNSTGGNIVTEVQLKVK